MSARILVVEDEPRILRALSALLRSAGYGAEGAGTIAAGLEAALMRPPDAVLLDLLLPDGNGLELCRRLREWSHVPIVVVSAVGDEAEKIAALDAGADDYVTKPYAPGELLARLRAVLRRAAGPPGQGATVSFADVAVDLGRREVRRAGQLVPLTPHEYGLLAERAPAGPGAHPPGAAPGGLGAACATETQYLRVYMGRLRRKLEADPARPQHLVTETGVGYRLRRDEREPLRA